MRLRIITAFSIAYFLVSPCNAAAPSENWIPSVSLVPSGNVVPAKILPMCEKPKYPRESLETEDQGVVTMSFHISRDGTLIEKRIDRTSGHPRLDFAAISALSQCPFKPETIDGIPVDSWLKIEYVWKLE